MIKIILIIAILASLGIYFYTIRYQAPPRTDYPFTIKDSETDVILAYKEKATDEWTICKGSGREFETRYYIDMTGAGSNDNGFIVEECHDEI